MALEFGSKEKLLVVRGVRLLRLVRVLRMVRHFKIMWRLVYGLLTASQTILSTTALILVSLFIFACVAVELIAKDADLLEDTSTRDIVIGRFRGVGKAILTLTQAGTDATFRLLQHKTCFAAYRSLTVRDLGRTLGRLVPSDREKALAACSGMAESGRASDALHTLQPRLWTYFLPILDAIQQRLGSPVVPARSLLPAVRCSSPSAS